MKRSVGIIIVAVALCMIGNAIAQDPILELKEKIIDLQNQGELGFREITLLPDDIARAGCFLEEYIDAR